MQVVLFIFLLLLGVVFLSIVIQCIMSRFGSNTNNTQNAQGRQVNANVNNANIAECSRVEVFTRDATYCVKPQFYFNTLNCPWYNRRVPFFDFLNVPHDGKIENLFVTYVKFVKD